MSTICALLGGTFVVFTSPPRYQASAKVILDYIKPDPITGEYVNNKMLESYVKTQVQMIRDFQVAIPAAETLGLLDNLDIQATYASIPGANPNDFPRWIAKRIIDSTAVRLVPDSNIIEIANSSNSPDGASQYVEAIRNAYIEATITAKRTGAASGAENLSVQVADQLKNLARLESARRQLEDANGVMPDMEALRLMDLVTSVRPLYVAQAPSVPSAARLTAVEAQLEEATKTLGPNHPRLRALKSARDQLAAQVERERADAAGIGRGAGDVERARQGEIERQRDKVLSHRQLALELRLIDEEIERRREQVNAINTRIAGLRQLTDLQQTNIVPFGEISAPTSPVFPNPPLILGGAGVLGLGLGGLLALLIEFMNRPARRPDQLEQAVEAPLIGVLPSRVPLKVRKERTPRRRKIRLKQAEA